MMLLTKVGLLVSTGVVPETTIFNVDPVVRDQVPLVTVRFMLDVPAAIVRIEPGALMLKLAIVIAEAVLLPVKEIDPPARTKVELAWSTWVTPGTVTATEPALIVVEPV